jgi:hypothetical protein
VITRLKRPSQLSAFEFYVLAGLRAKQLGQGCVPRAERANKLAVTALLEVAVGKESGEPGMRRSRTLPPPVVIVIACIAAGRRWPDDARIAGTGS